MYIILQFDFTGAVTQLGAMTHSSAHLKTVVVLFICVDVALVRCSLPIQVTWMFMQKRGCVTRRCYLWWLSSGWYEKGSGHVEKAFWDISVASEFLRDIPNYTAHNAPV